MTNIRLFLAGAGVLFFAGCQNSFIVKHPLPLSNESAPQLYSIAAVEHQPDINVPLSYLELIKENLRLEMKKKGSEVTDKAAMKIKILVTAYRMRGDFSRLFWGAFAGSDEVTSTVRVLDSSTGDVVGESVVTTRDATTFTGPQQLANAHAKKITAFLTGGK